MREGEIKWTLFVWASMVLCLLAVGRVIEAYFAEQYARVSG